MPSTEISISEQLTSLDQALSLGNYTQYLRKSRLLGRQITNEEKSRLLEDNIVKNLNSKEKTLDKLIPQLWRLRLFLIHWEDHDLSRDSEKRVRQFLKLKAEIDKADRRAIHSAVLVHAFSLVKEGIIFLKQDSISISEFQNITTQELIHFISLHIKDLNESVTDALNIKPEEIKLESAKMAKAISSFTTPTKKKKALKALGIFIAVIAALACGISTGGAIYLIPGIAFGVALGFGIFIFAVGFIANVRFFSQNLPDFLLTLVRKGGITECITQDGQRKQFSPLKKYLLMPVATFASLTVGVSGAALTYSCILKLLAAILPSLAILWPPLPIIIVAILAASICIVLTVATLTATLDMLKKPLPTRQELNDWRKSLTTKQIIGYIIKALVVPLALIGLLYFRIIAGGDLAELIGIIASAIISVVAYVAQIAFTVLAINKLCNVLASCFSSSTSPATDTVTAHKGFFSRIKSFFVWIYPPLCIISNAIGNAILAFMGNTSDLIPAFIKTHAVSVLGVGGCGLNSLAGNIPASNMDQARRELATQAIVNAALGGEESIITASTTANSSTVNQREPEQTVSSSDQPTYVSNPIPTFFKKDNPKTEANNDAVINVVVNRRTWTRNSN